MSLYNGINNFYGRNTHNDVTTIINDYLKLDKGKFLNTEYVDLIKAIDTDSFGMLFPFMFFTEGLIEYIESSKILLDFFCNEFLPA